MITAALRVILVLRDESPQRKYIRWDFETKKVTLKGAPEYYRLNLQNLQ